MCAKEPKVPLAEKCFGAKRRRHGKSYRAKAKGYGLPMCAKEPKVPLKKSPSERNAEGTLPFCHDASQNSGEQHPKMMIFGAPRHPSTEERGGWRFANISIVYLQSQTPLKYRQTQGVGVTP